MNIKKIKSSLSSHHQPGFGEFWMSYFCSSLAKMSHSKLQIQHISTIFCQDTEFVFELNASFNKKKEMISSNPQTEE